jgi:hypothetical protein
VVRQTRFAADANFALWVGNRHAWLHQHCRDRWGEARHKAAIETLAIMGIVEPPKDEALR